MKIPSWFTTGLNLAGALIGVGVFSFTSTEVLGFEGFIITALFIIFNSICFAHSLKTLINE